MTKTPETGKSKPIEAEPKGTEVSEAETKKAVQSFDTPRKRVAKRAKPKFGLSKEIYGILGIVLTSIVAPIIVSVVNNRVTTATTILATPIPAPLTATATLPSATVTPTVEFTATPEPTNTAEPTATATLTPLPGIDLAAADCIYDGNWDVFPDIPGVTSNKGCLELPGEWGITLNDGKLSLFPALGASRGVFGVSADVPANVEVTLTFNVKQNSGTELWIGFFNPQNNPDTSGVYFARLSSNAYRIVEMKGAVQSNKSSDLKIGSTPPYTLTLKVSGNRLTISGKDALNNPIVIGGEFQVPNPHRLFLGYRANKKNIISLDAFISNIEISAP